MKNNKNFQKEINNYTFLLNLLIKMLLQTKPFDSSKLKETIISFRSVYFEFDNWFNINKNRIHETNYFGFNKYNYKELVKAIDGLHGILKEL